MIEPHPEPPEARVADEEAPPRGDPPPHDASYGYALPGRRLAQVAMTSVVFAVTAIIATVLPQARPVVVPLCVALIPLFAVALAAAVPLVACGVERAPARALLAGWAVILGGAACDIYATVSHSPDLTREANPVLRGLLDNGVSLEQVYQFAAVLQGLFITLALVLWAGFLKHRRALVATMPPEGSLLAYLKAGTGGRELTYRQWLCPLAYSEFPWAWHLAWWTGVAFTGLSTYRFYLALEWYGVAPTHSVGVRLIAPAAVFLATCWWYAAWLRDARSRPGAEGAQPGRAPAADGPHG